MRKWISLGLIVVFSLSLRARASDSRDLRVQVRPPPVLYTFLTALIALSDFKDDFPSGLEEDRAPMSERQKLRQKAVQLKTITSAILQAYEQKVKTPEKPIESLEEFIALLEPTRLENGGTGEGVTDFEILIQRLQNPQYTIPKALDESVINDSSNFATASLHAAAEGFLEDRAEIVESVLADYTSGSTGEGASTLIGAIANGLMRGMLGGFLGSPKGFSTVLKRVASLADDVRKKANETVDEAATVVKRKPNEKYEPTEEDLMFLEELIAEVERPAILDEPEPPSNIGRQKKRQWTQQRKNAQEEYARNVAKVKRDFMAERSGEGLSPSAPIQKQIQSEVTASELAIQIMNDVADHTEDTISLLRSEQAVLEFIREVDGMGIRLRESFIDSFQRALKSVVASEIYSITKKVIDSPEIKKGMGSEEGKAVTGILEVLFDKYLTLVPQETIKNIIIELLRTQPNPESDFPALGIVIKHFGPIFQNLLQTIGQVTDYGTLQEIFKSLQDSGRWLPFERFKDRFHESGYKVVQNPDIKKETLSRYESQLEDGVSLVNIEPIPIKAGKLYQVHKGHFYIEGELRPVVIRLRIPGSESMLESERRMLLKLAKPLAVVFASENGDIPNAHRMENMISNIHRNLMEELDVVRTVNNQNQSSNRLTWSQLVKLSSGETVEFQFGVPRAYPAKPNSRVMVMDQVRFVSKDAMRDQYPEVTRLAGQCFYEHMVGELLIYPICGFGKERNLDPVEDKLDHGLIHGDVHPGNWLWIQPESSGDNQRVFPVRLIDFGLFTWIPKERLEKLALLSMGASYNYEPYITEALWALRMDRGNTPEKRSKNPLSAAKRAWGALTGGGQHSSVGDGVGLGQPLQLVSGYVDDCADIEDLRNEVKKVIKRLRKHKKYWEAGSWVQYMWLYNKLSFDRDLLSIDQGFRAIRSTYQWMGNSEEDLVRQNTFLGNAYGKRLFTKLSAGRLKKAAGFAAAHIRYTCAENLIRNAKSGGP